MADSSDDPAQTADATAERITLSSKQALRLLRHGEVVAMESIPWSSNYTFAVKLQGEQGAEIMAVYKPRRGETPLWDFPDGTLYRREYAAFVASRIIGWSFIPPTVIRDGPHGIGSMQFFVDHDPRADFFSYKAEFTEQLQRIALFDLLANNADRKGGHCLKGSDGIIWGIDHGLTFHPQPKLRTVIWDFGGDDIPPQLLADLERLVADERRNERLRSVLCQLLDSVEVDVFMQRIERALEIRTYPVIHGRRATPWPWH